MPAPRPALTIDSARSRIEEVSFRSSDRNEVDLEVEWLLFPSNSTDLHIDFGSARAALGQIRLDGGCRLTFEPGGQLERQSSLSLVDAFCEDCRAQRAGPGPRCENCERELGGECGP